tara:strand:- start:4709 stop:5866 length:1158 start_codon:yes stop_codon:yes gene_type:complete
MIAEPPPLPLLESEESATAWARAWKGVVSGLDWMFGLAAILVGLAVVAAIPILNFLSLGYMLECSGRVARTGKLRHGFVGIRKASILGSIAIFSWLALLPLRFVSSLWKDAQLIDPASGTTRFMLVLMILFSILALGHIGWACIRGGRTNHFLWPSPKHFKRWLLHEPGKFQRLRDGVMNYLNSLRLPHYFWLGARGFVGGLAWLALPVGILMIAGQLPKGPGFVLSLIGILGLTIAVVYVPFLQAHFAQQGRFRCLFELGEVRAHFRKAPFAFWLAMFITVLFAMPLYLLKVEMTPQELAWLPGLFFVISILPARLLSGWAMGRAASSPEPAFGLFRWISRVAILPIAFAYAFWVFLMQYFSWSGAASLLEQHAFLLPAPLLSL